MIIPNTANASVSTCSGLRGEIILPADKSISHRAAMFAALGEGTSILKGFSDAADPHSTLACLQQLGIEIIIEGTTVIIHGKGKQGWQAPKEVLDCGNSGTTMRLMAGLLAGQSFDTTLIGDDSLSSRPMGRIANPLQEMGGFISLTDGHAPMYIKGNPNLKGIDYTLPMASAQVKSCVLLAGLFASGETTVLEPTQTRDHTERMLGLLTEQTEKGKWIQVNKHHTIPAQTVIIPRDFSAAAFFLVAGSIVPHSHLILKEVGLNPTRNALLEVLRKMGAQINVHHEKVVSGEPIADLEVTTAPLTGIEVPDTLIANMIDEIPILAVAATRAAGTTTIRGASELRVKETDRIMAMTTNLRKMGVTLTEFPDGMEIVGKQSLKGTTVESFDDHRIAMAMAVAGMVAEGSTNIKEATCAKISFPTFWEVLAQISTNR